MRFLSLFVALISLSSFAGKEWQQRSATTKVFKNNRKIALNFNVNSAGKKYEFNRIKFKAISCQEEERGEIVLRATLLHKNNTNSVESSKAYTAIRRLPKDFCPSRPTHVIYNDGKNVDRTVKKSVYKVVEGREDTNIRWRNKCFIPSSATTMGVEDNTIYGFESTAPNGTKAALYTTDAGNVLGLDSNEVTVPNPIMTESDCVGNAVENGRTFGYSRWEKNRVCKHRGFHGAVKKSATLGKIGVDYNAKKGKFDSYINHRLVGIPVKFGRKIITSVKCYVNDPDASEDGNNPDQDNTPDQDNHGDDHECDHEGDEHQCDDEIPGAQEKIDQILEDEVEVIETEEEEEVTNAIPLAINPLDIPVREEPIDIEKYEEETEEEEGERIEIQEVEKIDSIDLGIETDNVVAENEEIVIDHISNIETKNNWWTNTKAWFVDVFTVDEEEKRAKAERKKARAKKRELRSLEKAENKAARKAKRKERNSNFNAWWNRTKDKTVDFFTTDEEEKAAKKAKKEAREAKRAANKEERKIKREERTTNRKEWFNNTTSNIGNWFKGAGNSIADFFTTDDQEREARVQKKQIKSLNKDVKVSKRQMERASKKYRKVVKKYNACKVGEPCEREAFNKANDATKAYAKARFKAESFAAEQSSEVIDATTEQ